MNFDLNRWMKDNFNDELIEKEIKLISDVKVTPKDLSKINTDDLKGKDDIYLRLNDNISIEIVKNDILKKAYSKDFNNIKMHILDDCGLTIYDRYDENIRYYDMDAVNIIKDIYGTIDLLNINYDLIEKTGIYPDIEVCTKLDNYGNYSFKDKDEKANYIVPDNHKKIISCVNDVNNRKIYSKK